MNKIFINITQIVRDQMQENKKNFDSQLQTYFGAIKQAIKQQHVNYLKTHPQLRQILNDFLSSCLLEQPQNVYNYARNYFAFFNYQKDVTKYKPLVISGCSGVGKGTLIHYLLEKYPNIFQLSISYTTRRPRQGQMHGREYYFVEKQEFQKQIEKNVFAEYCQVHGNYYGTHQGKLNQIINKGKICLLDIDLQGGQKIYSKMPQCNFLFIDPPSFQELEKRLRGRGTQTPQVIDKRLKNAHGELQSVKTLPYYDHFINGDLVKAQKQLLDLINNKYSLSIAYVADKKPAPKYKPLVISGCSGVGKGTLISYLLEKYPNVFELSVSYTTRKPRQGQTHGKHYYFVEKQEFQKQIEKNVFAEHCEVHGNYYGTHKGKLSQIMNKGKICLLDIDLQGGQKIHTKMPQCNFLFIDPPSFEQLERRLRGRGTQTPQVIDKRLKNARGELQLGKTLTYYEHFVNADLVKSEHQLVQLINKKYGINLRQ